MLARLNVTLQFVTNKHFKIIFTVWYIWPYKYMLTKQLKQ